MIFDALVALFFIAQIISGYRDGFLKTLLRTIGYIAGAIGGLYLALQYDQSGWFIFAIFLGAGVGAWAGTLLAKALKLTVVRGPLAWLNSLAGSILEAAKVIVLVYIIGTVLLIAPWSAGQNAVATSKIYNKIDIYAPKVMTEVRSKIEEWVSNPQM